MDIIQGGGGGGGVKISQGLAIRKLYTVFFIRIRASFPTQADYSFFCPDVYILKMFFGKVLDCAAYHIYVLNQSREN